MREDVAPPILETRGIRLRPLRESDYHALYEVATNPDTGFRWRFRGSTPSPEVFMRETWEGVFAQFAVERSKTGEFIGQVVGYGAHPRDQYAYIAVVSTDPGTGVLIIATALFIEYMFNVGGFRRLYIEMNDFNFSQVAGRIEEYFPEHVVIPDRDWYGDRYWDVHLLGCPRDHWVAEGNRIRRFVTAPRS